MKPKLIPPRPSFALSFAEQGVHPLQRGTHKIYSQQHPRKTYQYNVIGQLPPRPSPAVTPTSTEQRNRRRRGRE